MLINNLKFSIVSIDDRASENKDNTRDIMSNFQEINIECIDGNKVDSKKILDSMGITLNNWSWHSSPRGGELGLWLSNINLFNKIINQDFNSVLLFEDDAIISNKLPEVLSNILKEVPEDFDFLSMVFPISSKEDYKSDADLGLKLLCSAKYNHFGTYAILWSKSGAQKMLDILSKVGITCPIDIFMYDYLSKKGLINGYSLKPDQEQIVFHGHDKYGSTIDLDGKRGMLDV
jgi:GR25 family glycosyltransferase involved in LPS biosynthesis